MLTSLGITVDMNKHIIYITRVERLDGSRWWYRKILNSFSSHEHSESTMTRGTIPLERDLKTGSTELPQQRVKGQQ